MTEGRIAALVVTGNASRMDGAGRILRADGHRVIDPALPEREDVVELCRTVQRGCRPEWWEVDPERLGVLPDLPLDVRTTYGPQFSDGLRRLSTALDQGAPAAFVSNVFPPVVPLLLEALPEPSFTVVVADPAGTARALMRAHRFSPLHALAIWEHQTRQLLVLADRHGGRVVRATTSPSAEGPGAAGVEGSEPHPTLDPAVLLTPGQEELLAAVDDGRRPGPVGVDPTWRAVLLLEQELSRARKAATAADARRAQEDLRTLRGHIGLLEHSIARLERRSRDREIETDGLLVRSALRLSHTFAERRSLGARDGRATSQDAAQPNSTSTAAVQLPGPAPTGSDLATRLMLAGSWLDAADRWRDLLEEPEWTGERAVLPRAGAAVCEWIAHGHRGARGRTSRWAERRSRRDRGVGVVYSAVTREVDGAWWPGHRMSGFAHVRFTDDELDDLGVFDLRPLPYRGADPRRSARWVKTHPHVLFPDRRWAVWMDGNVLAIDDWGDVLTHFMRSGAPIGLVPHPERDMVEEEVAACIRLGKDRIGVLEDQARRLGPDPGVGLFETGLLMLDLEHPRTIPLLDRWWSLIDGGSTRDQVSLPYALRDCDVTPHLLMERPVSLRTHEAFVLVPHGGRAWSAARSALAERCAVRRDARGAPTAERDVAWASFRYELIDAQRERRVDIIIPVHDAYEEMRSCLRSVLLTRDPTRHRVIVVDDGSGDQVTEHLARIAEMTTNLLVVRNEEAVGFCRAANRGLRLVEAEMAIVLNSDTHVTGDWIPKLADAMFRPPGIGIVGPLSNAAGVQSWPRFEADEVERGIDQSPVNELPEGMRLEDVDALFERSAPLGPVRTSTVHGFCFAVRAEVLRDVGLFDEEAFPDGFGEEVDYCIRAVDAGWGLAWATSTFVWHTKSATYGPERRVDLVRRGRDAIVRKHGAQRLEQLFGGALETRRYLDVPEDPAIA